MTESKESIQERDWQILHDRITIVLDPFGEKNHIRKGDYWLVDDNYGWESHIMEVQNLDLFRPEIIGLLQQELSLYPGWDIRMGVDVVGKEKEWPGMGIIIYPDEVIDELQRDYLPDRFRNLIFGTIEPPPETQEQLAEKVRKLMKPRN